jgi:hypothetical protein
MEAIRCALRRDVDAGSASEHSDDRVHGGLSIPWPREFI